MRYVRLSLAFAVVALVYLYRLDKPLLWGDEADTGIFARNTLRVGYPVAYDDRNVAVFHNGLQVNSHLVCTTIPWVQYYLGALSLAIFGNDTAGLRVLFAIAGMLAFFPIYAVLKSRVKCPEVIAALALLAPQTVLFQRNARYYSILILLYAMLVWLTTLEFSSLKRRFFAAVFVFVLFFHTHPLAAMCSGIAWILYSALWSKNTWLTDSLSVSIGFLSWLVWRRLLGPALSETPLNISFIASDFLTWLTLFVQGLKAVVVDLDAVDCFPLLLWALLLGSLFWRFRKTAREAIKKPLLAFVLFNIIVQALATAALFGSELDDHYSKLRYMPHLLVFAMLSCFVLLNFLFRRPSVYLFACAFAVATNLMTWSFWAKPAGRNVPVSWVAPVYSEIFCPPESSWQPVISYLRSHAGNSPTYDTRVISLPAWTQDVALFYLGDWFLVQPLFDQPAPDCEQAIRQAMGNESFLRLGGTPDWIIDLQNQLTRAPGNYVVALTVPNDQVRPSDGNRPELTRHTFFQSDAVGNVQLFRKEND